MNILSSIEFIVAAQSLKWTFAKTMPECPHQYIVRGKTADDEVYSAMFRTIDTNGEWGEWGASKYKYYHPGDGYYYWKMTDDIDESVIVNRSVEDIEDEEK